MVLTSADKTHLAELYDTEGYKVLKTVMEAKITELGLTALNSRTVEYTAELRGQMQAFDWLHKELKGIHKEVFKLENS